MATKTVQIAVSSSTQTPTVKTTAEAVVKIETAEELRRRRAGVACFL